MTDLADLTRGPAVAERLLVAVRIAGPDARRFANNMFTNNVRDLPPGAANRHALTDDRGRVRGFLDLLCEADDTFVAFVEGMTTEAFLERFETYIVFDDVEMTPLDGMTGRLVLGEGALAAVAAASLPTPAPGSFTSGDWGYAWLQALGPTPGAGVGLALRDPTQLADLDALSDGDFTVARVLAGHAAFPDDTGPKALPHELGLRDVVLAFDKGCYLGQESINRIDVMGQVKRHLRVVRLSGTLDEPHEIRHGDKAVGQLTSPVQVGSVTIGLAILKQAAAEPGTEVRVGDLTGTVLTVPVSLDALL
ncbi:MAG: hypothetical protein AAF211_33105 [Myxococcota bacterium]